MREERLLGAKAVTPAFRDQALKFHDSRSSREASAIIQAAALEDSSAREVPARDRSINTRVPEV